MRASLISLISIIFLLSITNNIVLSQDRCILKDAPEVRGFKLGQTYNSLADRFPTALNPKTTFIDSNDIGLSSLELWGALLNEDERGKFNDVQTVDLQLLKDDKGEYPQRRIVSITISYDPSIKWKDNLEFTSIVADKLKLPRNGWLGRDPSVLKCDGFTVEASERHWLTITAEGIGAELARRKKELEIKRRESFKP